MKKALLILAMVAVCQSAFAQEIIYNNEVIDQPGVEDEIELGVKDYWVYVRLEDRPGVTADDDIGRSKRGDVVAVREVTPTSTPSETEKKEWMIYKATLTEEQAQSMTESWEETDTRVDTIDIPKEDWENAEKREQIKSNYQVVNVISENLVEKEVGSVIDVSGNIGSISVGGKEIDLTGEEGIIDTRHIAQVYEVEVNHEYQKPIAYRKRKVDLNSLGIPIKKGVSTNKVESKDIIMSVKTAEDFARYETNRKWYAYVKRPLKIVSSKIIGPAFAETVSTINKAGEDYNTITLWEDAVDGDLVTDTRQETAECYDDDGTLADNWDIDGSTTNASYYLKITSPVGERHDGTNTSGFLNTFNNKIYINDAYSVVEWLRLSSSGTYIDAIDGDNATSVMQNCIITGPEYKTIQGKYNMYNNLVLCNSWDTCFGLGGYRKAVNNTVIQTSSKTGTCFSGYNNDFVLANNICQNFTHSYAGYGTGGGRTFATNLSDDAEFPGTSVDNTTLSFVGGGDYHLSSSDTAAIDAATDYSSLFTIDIDGQTRSGTWDIGADEYVSAGNWAQIY